MSRAFTKEIDDAPVAPVRRRGVPVPDPNFVTPEGLRVLRAELDRGGDPDRMRELAEHLATAEPVDPPADRGEVGLGATVTVEDASGKRTAYHLVGAIETDAKHGHLSWQSPIANALWGLRVGDTALLPKAGEVAIVAIAYP